MVGQGAGPTWARLYQVGYHFAVFCLLRKWETDFYPVRVLGGVVLSL